MVAHSSSLQHETQGKTPSLDEQSGSLVHVADQPESPMFDVEDVVRRWSWEASAEEKKFAPALKVEVEAVLETEPVQHGLYRRLRYTDHTEEVLRVGQVVPPVP